jgi:signal transduction histidine kinase/PAS domain-containing protein
MTIIASDPFRALARVSELLRGSRPTRETLQAVVAGMPDLIAADAYAIWRYDLRAGEWHILAGAGLSPEYVATVVREPLDHRARNDEPFAIDDVRSSPLAAERRAYYEAEGIRALFILPLHIGGEATAALVCYFRERRDMTPREHNVGRVLADIVSAAISTTRFDRLAETARAVSAELDVHKLVQLVTDSATALTNAQFGAFFYNVVNAEGESYTLYAISGVPREHFSQFPMPRNTPVFEPTFSGTAVVRSSDIRRDPRYGQNAPHHGMPAGHLPVVSYLAAPVVSRTGEVLGGLFFGHHEVGVFTENEEQIVVALAAQAAVGIDTARLYEAMVRNESRYKALALAASARQTIWSTLEWLDRVHPDDRERATETWKQASESREPFRQQFRIRSEPADAFHWTDVRGVPVLRSDGSLLEWVGTITDVDDEHTAVEHLRFLAEASEVMASSLDYEITLQNVTKLAVRAIADWCTIDVIDEDGSFRRLSVAHVDPAKVELAHVLQEKYPPNPDTSAMARVMRTGTTEWLQKIPQELIDANAVDDEHRSILRALGLRSYISAPLTAHGRTLGAMSFILSHESGRSFRESDVRLAEELARRAGVAIENARLFSAASKANRAKDEFLATLSHELRTPMTAVVGWARMLKMGLSPEESLEAVDAIEKSASVQMQLIEDILDMSRIMAGKLRVDTAPVDMRSVAEAALTTVRPTAEMKGIEIVTSFTPRIPQVLGDANRLQQVVWNLLTNAVKFTGRGGTILVRVARTDAGVSLTVRDSGSGIDPSFLPHVFERFRQADSSTTRSHGGIGVGLAIVRYLVEMHGGTIVAESEGLGRGATFRIELPAIEARTRAAAPLQTNELPALEGTSVLIIDDEPLTRDVLAAILRLCKATVTTATSARDALLRVSERRPDVILCDIAMPGEDGYAFLRELRTQDARVPVIALTAFGRPEDRERALSSGFDAFLKKPVDPVTLATTVRGMK